MEDKGEVLYELKPKFDFLYEIMMPTGKKMKSALISVLITIIIKVILSFAKSHVLALNNSMLTAMFNICNILIIVAIIFSIILFVARIVIQVLEYRGMTYKFYKNCMIFENNFLNQTRKTIEYADIKEVEIRRTIMDRILNYGVIILYTSAEKTFGNATILYAIKNTQEHYNNIETLIHEGKIRTPDPIKYESTTEEVIQEIVDEKEEEIVEEKPEEITPNYSGNNPLEHKEN